MSGKKRLLVLTSIIVLVLGGGGYYAFASHSSTASATSYLLGEAKSGDVIKVVTAVGTIQNKNIINLSFGTSGRLSNLKVQVGDIVKKGQLLSELDKSTLQNQVMSSQANLKSAQAKLDSLKQGLSVADAASLQSQITRAQADLENAQNNLNIAKQNVDSSYLQSQIRDAANQLSLAQSHYDNVSKTGDAVQTAMAKAQLDQASKNYSSAISAQSNTSQAQTQLLSAENAVRTAQASYDSAVVQLTSKQQPATDADVAQADASVAQAQASLSTAENNLTQATLVAPFDGVVVASIPHEGEQIGGNATVLTLQSSDSAPQLVVPIDETDISQIKVGQKATVTSDSMLGQKFDATIAQIAPTGTTQSNVTTFTVTLTITGDTTILRVGQSMTANITIDKRTNVLTVPSEAIRGFGKKQSVQLYISDSEKPVQTDVVTGLDDGVLVEVKSGISAGQKVVLGVKSSTSTPKAQTPNPFGGGRTGGNLGGSGGKGNR